MVNGGVDVKPPINKAPSSPVPQTGPPSAPRAVGFIRALMIPVSITVP